MATLCGVTVEKNSWLAQPLENTVAVKLFWPRFTGFMGALEDESLRALEDGLGV